jgi:hypothetical protein
MKDEWSEPLIIKLVQFHFNSSLSSESGLIPFHAMLGSAVETYYKLDPNLPPSEYQTEYVRLLDVTLKVLRDISSIHQSAIVVKRTAHNDSCNQFSVRDLLLKTVRTSTHPWKSEKLGVNFTGPWEVLSVHKNDYTCKHITQNTIETFHVTMLKPYWGRLKPAKRVALLDFDQHVVVFVSDYVGNPN